MLYVESTVAADDPANVPLIGYTNVATSYAASEQATGHPADNMGNPATYLTWQARATVDHRISIATGGATVDYLGIAAHNFFENGVRVGFASSNSEFGARWILTSLLHFEGTDGSTVLIDSSGNDATWACHGNAQVDNAQFKFGTTSLSVPNAGTDYVTTQGAQFNISDRSFTIDMWVRFNSVAGLHFMLDSRDGSNTNGLYIYINGTSLRFGHGGSDHITGASVIAINTWYHVMVSRDAAAGQTRMFLNGGQEGSTYADTNVYDDFGLLATLGNDYTHAAQLNGWIDEFRFLDGSAVTTAFTAPTTAYDDGPQIISGFGSYSLLMHFDGTDNTQVFTDSGGSSKTVSVQAGSPALDTAQFKFGTASLLCDGGSALKVDGTGDDFAFGTGDFTIDFWVRNASLPTTTVYYDGRGDNNGSPVIYKAADNFVRYYVGGDRITGSIAMTTGAWIHIAVSRYLGETRLFINGVQDGSTYTDTHDFLAWTSRPILAGASSAGSYVNGWMDEVRIIKGAGLFTSNFEPPTRAADQYSTRGKYVDVDSNNPIIFRFSPSTATYLTVLLSSSSDEVQEIGVIYVGELLVLERSITLEQHKVITHARRANIVNGMSESGNFLGRIVLGQWRESVAQFAWFTPDWYRENFEPFVEAAYDTPFFWIWNPDEYPEETAFAWLSADVQPETDPVTRRVAVNIPMRAIA